MSQDAAAITAAVEAVEARSAAEIVVILAGAADGWRDLRAGAALACGLGTLAALCWGPLWVSDLGLPVWTGLAAGLGWVLAPWAVPLLPLAARRARVRRAAESAFVAENVHATVDRVGVLVYVAEREQLVEVVADVAVAAVVPDLDITWGAVPEGLRALGERVAPLLPAPSENKNLLGDAPRVRP